MRLAAILLALTFGAMAAPLEILDTDIAVRTVNGTGVLETREFEEWYEWVCVAANAGGSAALKRIHAGFNRVFGGAALTIAKDQCYVAECGGVHFAVCNWSCCTRREISNARNVAKDRDPGSGDQCMTTVQADPYIKYYFGEGSPYFGSAHLDKRYC